MIEKRWVISCISYEWFITQLSRTNQCTRSPIRYSKFDVRLFVSPGFWVVHACQWYTIYTPLSEYKVLLLQNRLKQTIQSQYCCWFFKLLIFSNTLWIYCRKWVFVDGKNLKDYFYKEIKSKKKVVVVVIFFLSCTFCLCWLAVLFN